MMRTFCRFGSNLRGVARMEWLRLFPKLGPFPHTLQTFDIGLRPRVAVELLVSPALRRPERHSAQLCRYWVGDRNHVTDPTVRRASGAGRGTTTPPSRPTLVVGTGCPRARRTSRRGRAGR